MARHSETEMKIGIISDSFCVGGAEKQAVIDANLLSSRHKVVLIAFEEGPLLDLVNQQVDVTILPRRGYLHTSLQLSRILVQKRIQVAHAQLFAPMVIATLASLASRVPLIWHFNSHEYYINAQSRLALQILSFFPSVRKIAFVSEELRESFRLRFRFPRTKLEIVYNSASLQPRMTQRDGLRRSMLTIGYVGRLVGLKRVNLLLELAAYLKEKQFHQFRIVIVGDGPERGALELETRDRGLTDQISFLGFQSNPERYYDDFDVFVLPSREECLSLALIDAGIRGLPSVVFAVGGNEEIVMDGRTGFVVKAKEDFFARTLLLCSNAAIRSEMGKSATETCAAKFGLVGRLRNVERISSAVLENGQR